MLLRIIKKLWTILLFVLFFAIYIYIPRLIIVKNISCKSQYNECNKAYINELNSLNGISYRVSKKEADNILHNSLVVSDYSIKLKLPDTLEINTLENKAKFALYDVSKMIYLIVDKNGLVLTTSDESNLPTVLIDETDTYPKYVSEDKLFSLGLVYDIYNTLGTRQAVINGDELDLISEDGYKIILPVEGDRKLIVGSLVFLLSEINNLDLPDENDRKIDTIDLRFKNPVLRY